MAINLIDKIKPKNNGGFAMVDAEDVEMTDGTRLSDHNIADKEFVIDIFEQLKVLIADGKTDEAIAVLDAAILDLAILA